MSMVDWFARFYSKCQIPLEYEIGQSSSKNWCMWQEANKDLDSNPKFIHYLGKCCLCNCLMFHEVNDDSTWIFIFQHLLKRGLEMFCNSFIMKRQLEYCIDLRKYHNVNMLCIYADIFILQYWNLNEKSTNW